MVSFMNFEKYTTHFTTWNEQNTFEWKIYRQNTNKFASIYRPMAVLKLSFS